MVFPAVLPFGRAVCPFVAKRSRLQAVFASRHVRTPTFATASTTIVCEAGGRFAKAAWTVGHGLTELRAAAYGQTELREAANNARALDYLEQVVS